MPRPLPVLASAVVCPDGVVSDTARVEGEGVGGEGVGGEGVGVGGSEGCSSSRRRSSNWRCLLCRRGRVRGEGVTSLHYWLRNCLRVSFLWFKSTTNFSYVEVTIESMIMC